jgi:hypothetical protein
MISLRALLATLIHELRSAPIFNEFLFERLHIESSEWVEEVNIGVARMKALLFVAEMPQVKQQSVKGSLQTGSDCKSAPGAAKFLSIEPREKAQVLFRHDKVRWQMYYVDREEMERVLSRAAVDRMLREFSSRKMALGANAFLGSEFGWRDVLRKICTLKDLHDRQRFILREQCLQIV